MLGMILAAFVLVITMLLTMARLDLRKFLGYAAVIDVAFTILMFAMFAGSYSGIVAGAFAGLFMTACLYVLRYSMGYKKLRMGLKGPYWKLYEPKAKRDASNAFHKAQGAFHHA